MAAGGAGAEERGALYVDWDLSGQREFARGDGAERRRLVSSGHRRREVRSSDEHVFDWRLRKRTRDGCDDRGAEGGGLMARAATGIGLQVDKVLRGVQRFGIRSLH